MAAACLYITEPNAELEKEMPDIFDSLFCLYLKRNGLLPVLDNRPPTTVVQPTDPPPAANPDNRKMHPRSNSEETLTESFPPISDCESQFSNTNAGTRISESTKFKCDFKDCGKEFIRKEHLNRHFRIHTKQKPFLCWIEGCPKSFSRSDNRDAHVKNVHYGQVKKL